LIDSHGLEPFSETKIKLARATRRFWIIFAGLIILSVIVIALYAFLVRGFEEHNSHDATEADAKASLWKLKLTHYLTGRNLAALGTLALHSCELRFFGVRRMLEGGGLEIDLEAIHDRAEELCTTLRGRFTVGPVRQVATGSCYFFIWPLAVTEDDFLNYHNCAEVRVADHPQSGRSQVGLDVDASLPLNEAVEQILAAAADFS